MDITSYTIDQLKVIAYDTLVQLETYKANLNVINQEIEKKKKEEVKETITE